MYLTGAKIRVPTGAGIEHLKRLGVRSEYELISLGCLSENPKTAYFFSWLSVPKAGVCGFDNEARQFVIGQFDLSSQKPFRRYLGEISPRRTNFKLASVSLVCAKQGKHVTGQRHGMFEWLLQLRNGCYFARAFKVHMAGDHLGDGSNGRR